MRKFILITAMVLASASAQAGGLRALTLASNDEPVTAMPAKAADAKSDIKPVDAKPVETPPAETPKFVDRPAAVDGNAQQSADQCPCGAPVNAAAPKTVKPKHRHESTEARVIYELHRHGIYW